MRLSRALPCLLLAFAPILLADEGALPAPFEIRDGDRVVFLGDTLLERESTYGYLELGLVEHFADRHFTVRNLSWSGDTPRGVSRAMFDPPEKGWERLKDSLAEAKPTVVFLGYGMAASLQEITDRSGDITLNPDPVRYGREPMTAARFRRELSELMDAIDETARKNGQPAVRYVLLSPIQHEDLRTVSRKGLPDPGPHNLLLASYSHEIQDLARTRGAHFVSLANLRSAANPRAPLTTNGIHLGESGSAALASRVANQLGWTAPAFDSRDPLRQAVIRKDQLFFHRFRPENWTYLFGFRKHEQGQNAGEIPKFDPLIAGEEAEIDRLKKLSLPARLAEAAKPVAAPSEPVAEPPKELPKFDVEKGFEIKLWAANPLLQKPVEMNWDSEGRLWVASSNTYPQINPQDVAASLASDIAQSGKAAPSSGNDKIIILEDPGHTGVATKSTVFAEGLLIPTGVAPFHDADGHWGCYVGASTELISLLDSTGSGKADQRRIILSGFGSEDTHHIVHTLRWGPDGRLFFDQSIYIHSHFETPWGMVRLNSGGVLSWDPRTERVEVVYKGFCNPWGHAWDEWNQEFVTDGAGFEGVSWGIPEALYFTYENGRKIAPSISPGTYPKFASLELIHSPLFPADWQGSAMTNDFRAHRIVHFGIHDLSEASDPAQVKSGYITKELPDLVRTGDLSFRPIDLKQGPDGALYVADWSNPVINHGEVDFRDPRRDHYSGRIWRIALAEKAPLPWKKLTDLTVAQLQPLLKSANEWTKEQSRRVLIEPDVLRPTYVPGVDVQPDSFAPNDNPKYRAIAARLLGISHGNPSAFGNLPFTGAPAHILSLPELAADPSPRVRVEAMRALARTPTWQNAALVLDAALRAPADDPFYDYAAWLSINDLADPWIKALASGEWKIEGHEKQLELALASIDPNLAAEALSKVLAARDLPRDGGPWIDLVSKAGGPAELRKLYDALVNQRFDAAAAVRAIDALREAARVRNARPSGDLSKIAAFLTQPDVHAAAGAARLMGAWKLPGAVDALQNLASADGPSDLRLAAIDGLRELGGDAAVKELRVLAASSQALEIRCAALVALAQTKLADGVAASGDVLAALPDEKSALETWRALLRIKGAPEAFAAKLPENLPSPTLAAGLRAARELGKNGAALEKVFANRTGTKIEAASGQNYASIVELVKRDGDPARGETIFRRPQLACLTCHAIGGAGGKVGPDLGSLGASAPLDYIIESVLVPNAKVKEGFNAVSITLQDGSVAMGIQTRETPQEIFLRSAAGQETSVPKAKIVSRENVGSIMPAGLVDPLPERERLDLYAFLAQLGKPGVYDASKGNVARYWALYPGSAAPIGLVDPSYTGPSASGYTLVDGRLTRDLLQTSLQLLPGAVDAVAAVSRFQLSAAGPARLDLQGASEAWLDGKPAAKDPSGCITADLSAGEHTLAVRLDPKQLPDVLRVECADAKFLGN